MPDLRLVLQCLKGEVTYHGQVDSDVILTERGRHESFLDIGPYVFKKIRPDQNQPERDETEDGLTGDNLKQYETDIEAMNLILISIPNDIYNSVDSSQTAKEMWLWVKRLMQGTRLSKVDREACSNNEFDQFTVEPGESLYVTNVRLARNVRDVPYDELFDYLQQYEKLIIAFRAKRLKKTHDPLALVAHTRDTFQNDPEDTLTSAMMLLAHAITQPKKDEVGVILSNKQNDFLIVDAAQMEEIKELSVNICMMARIQPTNINSDDQPSYDSAFISELNANEDKYLDDVLNLKAKLKKNENVVMKMCNSVQALFMLGLKPLSVYGPQLEHGLGYENPYTLKQAISQNLKLYDALYLHSSKVHVNACDTEEIINDATKSQIKMENKLKDPITIEKKQIFRPIDYGKLNDLYETFVPQAELYREQIFFIYFYDF
ncbi:hypothetical protein Tco_0532815 [Tanacetum coccineum]